MKTLFWFSLLGLIYIYVGYPCLIALWARLRTKPVRRGTFTGTATVLMSSYNEGEALARKLKAFRDAAAYSTIDEILVGSDGSTDGSIEQIRRGLDSKVRLVDFPARRGKASVLNDLIALCRSEILVFCDVRQRLDREAIARLLENFADEKVGVVSGELHLEEPVDRVGAGGVGAYWRYEKWIRKSESAAGSVPGATGALYAIRRSLVRPIPSSTLLDDVAIPMQAVMQGWRCVFDERAAAFDQVSSDISTESVRKRRTIAGNIQLIRLFPGYLLPWRNPIWFQFVSHKVSRLFSPFLLLGLLVSSLWLAPDWRWAESVAYGQAAVYLAALAGSRRSARSGLPGRLAGIARAFVSMNFTTLLAWGDALSGRFEARWQRSPVVSAS